MSLVSVRCGSSDFLVVRVEWTKDSGGRWKMEEVPGSEKFFEAQLVLLALGFLGPEAELIKVLGVKTDPRSNVQTPSKVCFDLILRRKIDWSLEIFNECRGCICRWRLSAWTVLDRLGNKVCFVFDIINSV